MPRYDEVRVPSGTSHKWEIVIEDGSGGRIIATPTAAEVKREHRLLRDIPDHLLGGVPLLPAGAELERGEWYFDLHNPARGEFPGGPGERVRPGQRVIAKRAAPAAVWRALLEAADDLVERRHAASEASPRSRSRSA